MQRAEDDTWLRCAAMCCDVLRCAAMCCDVLRGRTHLLIFRLRRCWHGVDDASHIQPKGRKQFQQALCRVAFDDRRNPLPSLCRALQSIAAVDSYLSRKDHDKRKILALELDASLQNCAPFFLRHRPRPRSLGRPDPGEDR